MTVDHDGDEYLYVQLAGILRAMIESGELPPGRVLPSSRTLHERYDVSIGVAKKAIAILQQEGLVRTVIGRGIFVTRERQGDSPPPRQGESP